MMETHKSQSKTHNGNSHTAYKDKKQQHNSLKLKTKHDGLCTLLTQR